MKNLCRILILPAVCLFIIGGCPKPSPLVPLEESGQGPLTRTTSPLDRVYKPDTTPSEDTLPPSETTPDVKPVKPVYEGKVLVKKDGLEKVFDRSRGGKYHTVMKDETLESIANAYGIDAKLIAELNNIKPSEAVEGTKLFIPQGADIAPKRTYTDKRTTSLPKKLSFPASRFGYSWPVKGAVAAGFGDKYSGRSCNGVAIKAGRGEPVTAAADGKVVLATDNFPSYGRTIMIDHGNGIISMYGHLDLRTVKFGDKVERGTVIGTVGKTGRLSEPILFFAVIRDFEFINPLPYLP